MIAQGAIIAKGTAENPITFTSMDDSWGGALVTNAKKRSSIEHLHFSNAVGIGPSLQKQGIDRIGWMLTGGLTFHECNVDILNCKFKGLRSEDALNLISSDFRMLGCFFSEVSSDALDGDFVKGLIKGVSHGETQMFETAEPQGRFVLLDHLQPHQRFRPLGDDDIFSIQGPLYEPRQVRFCLVDRDGFRGFHEI